MEIFCVGLVQLLILFDVPGIVSWLANLWVSVSLYLFLDSCITLSQSKERGSSSAGNAFTIDTGVAGEWERAAFICGKIHAAEDHFFASDVEPTADDDERKD